jgi:hypothetical protein
LKAAFLDKRYSLVSLTCICSSISLLFFSGFIDFEMIVKLNLHYWKKDLFRVNFKHILFFCCCVLSFRSRIRYVTAQLFWPADWVGHWYEVVGVDLKNGTLCSVWNQHQRDHINSQLDGLVERVGSPVQVMASWANVSCHISKRNERIFKKVAIYWSFHLVFRSYFSFYYV